METEEFEWLVGGTNGTTVEIWKHTVKVPLIDIPEAVTYVELEGLLSDGGNCGDRDRGEFGVLERGFFEAAVAEGNSSCIAPKIEKKPNPFDF